MGPETLAAGGGTADPVLIALVTTLLGGGTLSALAAWRRARGGAQLDVLTAAKVIYDELREQNDELRETNRELAEQRDQALEREATLIGEIAHCNERIAELQRRVDHINGP